MLLVRRQNIPIKFLSFVYVLVVSFIFLSIICMFRTAAVWHALLILHDTQHYKQQLYSFPILVPLSFLNKNINRMLLHTELIKTIVYQVLLPLSVLKSGQSKNL